MEENGSIYITRTDIPIRDKCRLGGKIAAFAMTAAESIDIDTAEDLPTGRGNHGIDRYPMNIERNIAKFIVPSDVSIASALTQISKNKRGFVLLSMSCIARWRRHRWRFPPLDISRKRNQHGRTGAGGPATVFSRDSRRTAPPLPRWPRCLTDGSPLCL